MATTEHESKTLNRDWMLPDLIRTYPRARQVFDRYGLRGCGGRFGPQESVGFFAQAHGVDEDRLLAELRQAMVEGDPKPRPEPPRPIDTIYRRFFLAAIAVTLTAGATWGTWLLWSIGFDRSFQAPGVHQINAHGAAQIFGWVGLFIMGFAYQAFPRMWQTELAAPRLAGLTFVGMVLGIVLRTVGMTLTGASGLALPLAMTGGGLQIAAVTMFTVQIGWTLARSGQAFKPAIGFISAALVWFVASTVFSVWHTWSTITAGSTEALVQAVATYQAPLRDLQIHGLAMFMIFGVGIRMFPGLFGVPKLTDRRGWWAFGLLTAGLLGEIGLFLVYRWTGNHWLAASLMGPWLLLAIGIGLIVVPWRPWRRWPQADRSGKFARAAFGWLAVSIAMLLLLPVYQAVSGIPFSHAYYGAIRHAITVGFISMMILGMAAKIVPTLNGFDPKTLSSLWGPFLLINTGCSLRVITQVLTDWTDQAYAMIGISGTLEVTALAWWALHLIGLIRLGRRWEQQPIVAESYHPREQAPETIELHHRVADILAWYPESEPVWEQFGATMLKNPMMRRTVATQITVRQAAMVLGVNPSMLISALNEVIRHRLKDQVDQTLVLPVLSSNPGGPS